MYWHNPKKGGKLKKKKEIGVSVIVRYLLVAGTDIY
jgi:hypothetical protein